MKTVCDDCIYIHEVQFYFCVRSLTNILARDCPCSHHKTEEKKKIKK